VYLAYKPAFARGEGRDHGRSPQPLIEGSADTVVLGLNIGTVKDDGEVEEGADRGISEADEVDSAAVPQVLDDHEVVGSGLDLYFDVVGVGTVIGAAHEDGPIGGDVIDVQPRLQGVGGRHVKGGVVG